MIKHKGTNDKKKGRIMKTYIVRINNDKMFDKYFLTYNEALDECAICKELFSDAQIIEEDL